MKHVVCHCQNAVDKERLVSKLRCEYRYRARSEFRTKNAPLHQSVCPCSSLRTNCVKESVQWNCSDSLLMGSKCNERVRSLRMAVISCVFLFILPDSHNHRSTVQLHPTQRRASIPTNTLLISARKTGIATNTKKL